MPDHPWSDEERGLVGRRMVVDHHTLVVVAALAEAGVESVLLKGPAIARWLYDGPGERSYDDIDLLVGPQGWATTESVLAGLGFERWVGPRPQVPRPAGQREHADTWLRPSDNAAVDLHRCLHHTEHLDPQLVWDEIWGDHDHVEVSGTPVAVPAERIRALHVSLHLQPKDVPGTKAWTDLERAVERLPWLVWEQAAEVAGRFGVRAEMGALLALVPGGAEVATRLQLPTAPPRALVQHHRRHAPGISRLALRIDGRGRREAIRLVAAKALPSPARLREVSPLARAGRLGLLRAYGAHVSRAPQLVRDWARYRRDGGSSLR